MPGLSLLPLVKRDFKVRVEIRYAGNSISVCPRGWPPSGRQVSHPVIADWPEHSCEPSGAARLPRACSWGKV